MEVSLTGATSATRSSSAARRVLGAGAVGHFVEFYDFAIYGFSVVTIAKLFFPAGDPVVGILAAFAVYGVAFVVRPLGGVFFGALGDRIGRRKVLALTLLSIGGATALIGLLPSYEQIGILAPVLLLLCRLVQGFSAGGEAVGAPSFVLEHAPRDRRALWIGITTAMSAVPSIVAGIFILGLTTAMSAEDYASWGWRIPFLVAAPLSLVGLYIRRKTEESEAFKQAVSRPGAKESSPLRETFLRNRLRMTQVFFIMSLNALTFYFLVGYFVTYLQTVAKLSQADALLSNAAGLLTFSLLLPLAGRISDTVGRKPMLLAGALCVALVSLPAFWLLTSGTLANAVSAQILLAAALSLYGGGSYTFFVELFPTSTRFTGAAISYNASYALFGGTAPFVGTFLVRETGNSAAPGYYLAAIAVCVFLIALTVPETARRDLGPE